MSELKKTPFYTAHVEANGKIVDFSGWSLPIHYGSQIREHEAVRTDVGMFDVSHMMVSDITGSQAKAWLQKLLANDVAKLNIVGKALYSPMLNPNGGVMDDLIVYRMNEAETEYRIVSNAATREKDSQHFHETTREFDVNIQHRSDVGMLAVQGPNAITKLSQARPNWADKIHSLKVFQGVFVEEGYFVARTGYTGEDGVEIILPAQDATTLFQDLVKAGVTPCGLGARDTLRMEAGMNLYGHDMDDNTTPLEAGMAWTVSFSDRDFIGKEALLKQKEAGLAVKQVGLLLESRGVLREGMEVNIPNIGHGVITSGTFSPTLKQSIAIARVPKTCENFAQVDIRGHWTDVRVLKLPFVRNGKRQFE